MTLTSLVLVFAMLTQAPPEPTSPIEGQTAAQEQAAEQAAEQDKEQNQGPPEDPAASDQVKRAAEGDATKRANFFVAAKPKIYWDQGLRLILRHPALHARLGAKLQVDAAFFVNNEAVEAAVGKLETGAEVRRQRLYVEGDLFEHFEFKFEVKTTGPGDGGTLKDFFVGVRNLPVRVRIGSMKEPFGLDNTTNSLYTTFMERALPTPLASTYSTGILLGNGSRSIFHLNDEVRRFTYNVGVFQSSEDTGFSKGVDAKVLSGRVTALPWLAPDRASLLHLGASYNYRQFSDDQSTESSQKPESNLANEFVDSGVLAGEYSQSLGFEAAFTAKRFAAQAEWIGTWINPTEPMPGGNYFSHGYYVQASYFLTDDRPTYRYSNGTFGPIFPVNGVRAGGMGAWQIAARYSYIDLDDGPIRGGKLSDWTFGVNWYWADHGRWTLNFISARLYDVGTVPIVQVRLQLDI